MTVAMTATMIRTMATRIMAIADSATEDDGDDVDDVQSAKVHLQEVSGRGFYI